MTTSEKEWKDKWNKVYENELLGYIKRTDDIANPIGENEFFINWLYPTRKFTDNDIVLEIGCGQGNWIHHLYDKVRTIYGIDISDFAIERAKHFFRDEFNVFLYAETDLLKLFNNTKFDVIYSITVFQHLPKWQVKKYFEQSYKILKEDGIFFFNVFAEGSTTSKDVTIDDLDINNHHPHVGFEETELKDCLLNAGFTNIDIKFWRVEHPDPKYGWYIVIAKK